ncbi:MAG: DUF2520 domain-containing protein [Sphingobacteriales bacterium]|nr:MAG: DUF2520 domain-containing protein [Sphingobacteriales bacterium]
MNIVLIGSGNVATVLGKKIQIAGHDILQVAGRNEAACAALSTVLKCSFTINWNFINQQADLYIIAVADTALEHIHAQINLGKKIVVHTAGSVSKEVLHKVSKNYGVLYPVQSLHKEKEVLPEIPFLVDGNSNDTIALLKDFAETISDKVRVAADEPRKKIHLAAVLVNNFTNHLYALTEDFCKNEQLDFKILLPLIEETAERIKLYSPADVQTGPAVRGDETTINMQLGLLQQYPPLIKLYELFSESIRSMHKNKNPG